jgi:hypothetical protein
MIIHPFITIFLHSTTTQPPTTQSSIQPRPPSRTLPINLKNMDQKPPSLWKIFGPSHACSSRGTTLVLLFWGSLISAVCFVYFCLYIYTHVERTHRVLPTYSNTSMSLGSQQQQQQQQRLRDVESNLDLEQGLPACSYNLPRTANVRFRW